MPVTFRLDDGAGVIDIVGFNLARSQKWRNVQRDGRVALVVDDLETVDPWRPRGIQVRGVAEALVVDGPQGGADTIRLTPGRIVAWGLDTHPYTRVSRDVAAP